MSLRYKISNIKTLRFETNETVSSGKEKVNLGVSYYFRVPHFIVIVGNFRFFDQGSERDSLFLSAEIEYDIHPEDFTSIKNDENIVVLPRKVAQLFSNMVIDTARGILHVRTENTKYAHFIIPPISISKSIDSDVAVTAKQ